MVEGLTSSATDQGSAPRRVRGTPGAWRPTPRDIEDPGASRAHDARGGAAAEALDQTHEILVTLAERPHPFPSRTRKLSSPAPKILRGQPFGKIGRRQDFCVSGPGVRARGAPRRGRRRRERRTAIAPRRLSCRHDAARRPGAGAGRRRPPRSPPVPHLVSVDGPWHAATPSRAHRCRLLTEGRPTLDRQREHCLSAGPRRLPDVARGPRLGRAGRRARARSCRRRRWSSRGPASACPPRARPAASPRPSTVVVVGRRPRGAPARARAAGARNVRRRRRRAVGIAVGIGGAGHGGTLGRRDRAARPPADGDAEADADRRRRPPRPARAPTRSSRATRSAGSRRGSGRPSKKLAALNNIANPSLIRVGQVLQLP